MEAKFSFKVYITASDTITEEKRNSRLETIANIVLNSSIIVTLKNNSYTNDLTESSILSRTNLLKEADSYKMLKRLKYQGHNTTM